MTNKSKKELRTLNLKKVIDNIFYYRVLVKKNNKKGEKNESTLKRG